MTEYWFKPRLYGYGATPVHWKGWVAGAAFLAAVIGISYLLLSDTVVGSRPAPGRVLLWATLVGVATSIFVKFCKSRTNGAWRWRWGGKS